MNYDFLISSERSGSNLITKLVDAHSEYCAPSPPHIIRTFYNKIEFYNDLKNEKNWSRLVSDFLIMFDAQIGSWEANFTFEELFELKEKTFISLIMYIYRREAELSKKKNVFIKEVKSYKFYDFVINQFPESRFVYLVRDPRDMALSWKNSPVHRGDLVRAAKIWQEDQSSSIELLKNQGHKILLITYENLISNQAQVLIRICSFLKIDYEVSMLDFHKNRLAIQNSGQTDNWKNLNKEILSNNSKKYLSKLSKEEIRYIEYVCCKEMEFLNYTPEFPLMNEEEFNQVENLVLSKERYNKPEYELVSEEEKLKRTNWMCQFNRIKNL